ncbi:MAG: hypothetical protein LBK03_05285 [Bacteroidales bacterium]|jgi:hypothetical protein|nr:hypothetical protein [Bacteroidales bacterium]
MNRKFSILLALLAAITLAVSFSKCKKDESCKVRIICRQSLTGVDTGAVIPQCEVEIGKDSYASYAHVTGVANASGVFEYTFKLEALLDVKANAEIREPVTDSTFANFPYEGVGQVKLIPGETVEKTILLLKQQ